MRRSAIFPLIGRPLALITLLLLALPLTLSAQALRPFTTEDALRVKSVSIADATEDARWLAATVATAQSRMNTDHFRFGDPTYVGPSLVELFVMDAETGERWDVFQGQVQVTSLTWSPSGDRLAFLQLVGDEVRLQLWDRDSKRVRRVGLRPQRQLAWGAG